MQTDKERQPLDPRIHHHYYTWYNDEWKRQGTIIGQLEHHAITYLMTANGGSATAVIAFVGASGFMHPSTDFALGLFVLGLILCGVSIAAGHCSMMKVQKELDADFTRFLDGAVDGKDLASRNNLRHQKSQFGYPAAWMSFGCLILGMILSVWAYREFNQAKAIEKAKQAEMDKAKQTEVDKRVIEKPCLEVQKTASKATQGKPPAK